MRRYTHSQNELNKLNTEQTAFSPSGVRRWKSYVYIYQKKITIIYLSLKSKRKKLMEHYDLLSNMEPKMPRQLPPFVRHAISKVPDHLRTAAANMLFPPTEAQMHDIQFRYWDNTLHEPNGMEGCVGISAVGKGYIDYMIEEVIRYLRQHDEDSQRKLAEWARIYKSKGQSKDKPDRPTDAAILVPEPDMTNPALIQLLIDAQNEGNRSLYTHMPEVDLLDQCCASHKKVTKVIRLNFDTKRYGAQRATAEGVTGNPTLRWKFTFACVPEKARSFFRDSHVEGTTGRIGFNYVPRPTERLEPRQGDYDDKYRKQLDEYLVRLRGATGTIEIPKLDRLIRSLKKEMEDIADLSDDLIFESMSHRSLMIAWMKGCVLYVSEGYRFTSQIASFVTWSLYHDLWSKMQIFALQFRKAGASEVVDVRKYGPANMLDMLPSSFSKPQLEQMRQSMDKPVDCTQQLRNWLNRGYITYDEATQLYSKTEGYLARK